MTSKVQLAADYSTIGRENLGTGAVLFLVSRKKKQERNGETPLRTGSVLNE